MDRRKDGEVGVGLGVGWGGDLAGDGLQGGVMGLVDAGMESEGGREGGRERRENSTACSGSGPHPHPLPQFIWLAAYYHFAHYSKPALQLFLLVCQFPCPCGPPSIIHWFKALYFLLITAAKSAPVSSC